MFTVLTMFSGGGAQAAGHSRVPSLAETAAIADLIVEGTIESVFYEIASDGLPLTRFVVVVDNALHGSVISGKVLVGYPGGQAADGTWSFVAGCPLPKVGDHLLVLGHQKSEDRVVPVSWFSGVYVESLAEGASVAVSADHQPLAALPGAVVADAGSTTVQWTDLLAEVEAAVASSARLGGAIVGYVEVAP